MNYKWLHSKVTCVIVFLEESQEVEAWKKLDFGQDMGMVDLGIYFFYVVTSPRERSGKKLGRLSGPWVDLKVALIQWMSFLTNGDLTLS